MLTIIFILLILIALGAIAYVVVPKLPLISSIEVKETPQEQWKRIKRNIVIGRLARKLREISVTARKRIFTKERQEEIYSAASKLQKKFKELESRYKTQSKEHRIALLIKRGRDIIADDPDEAEKNFLETVRLEPKNLEAYEGLFEIYGSRRSVKEAEETGRFLMRINPASSTRYAFSIADVFLTSGDAINASAYALQALAEEPENPKYLDFLIECAILASDRKSAKEYLKRLEKVNPENAKIGELGERIKNLE